MPMARSPVRNGDVSLGGSVRQAADDAQRPFLSAVVFRGGMPATRHARWRTVRCGPRPRPAQVRAPQNWRLSIGSCPLGRGRRCGSGRGGDPGGNPERRYALVACVDGTTSMARHSGLSESTVGRIWRKFQLKPHLTGTFKMSADPSLFAAFDVATGEVVSSLHRRPRAAGFKKFLVKIDKQVPAPLQIHRPTSADEFLTQGTRQGGRRTLEWRPA